MNVLFAASEAVPFCKTGGLADVAGDLPKAILAQLPDKRKSRILRFLPKHSLIDPRKFALEKIPGVLKIPVGEKIEEGGVYVCKEGPLWTFFVENEKYFDRPALYGQAGKDFEDNDERFAFFSRAALELCKLIDFVPDIVHCHDWQTGLIPAYLKTVYATDAFFHRTASIFTIHNIAYQGNFHKQSLVLTGLGWSEFTQEKLEFFDQVSFLKAGLTYSDYVTTVSPGYAREIQTTERYGAGMEGILKLREKNLRGILNGIDENTWNPAKDSRIISKFSPRMKDFEWRKKSCKRELQKLCGLGVDNEAPLLSMVARVDPQKGFRMTLEILPKIFDEHPKVQAVILGSGAPDLEKELTALSERFKGRFCYEKGFNDPLAHKIYAGSDIFLMPSEFEPCGLGQMIAMKYGTIPVVTPTGGLLDTVTPKTQESSGGNGFICADISSAALHQTLWKALKTYEDRQEWRTLMKNAMTADFSWKRSAQEYLKLYENASQGKTRAD